MPSLLGGGLRTSVICISSSSSSVESISIVCSLDSVLLVKEEAVRSDVEDVDNVADEEDDEISVGALCIPVISITGTSKSYLRHRRNNSGAYRTSEGAPGYPWPLRSLSFSSSLSKKTFMCTYDTTMACIGKSRGIHLPLQTQKNLIGHI